VPIDTDEGEIICNLISVHAGLERTIDLNEQLRVLRTRDTRVPKVQMFSGRQDVWDTPKVKKSASYFCLVYHKRNIVSWFLISTSLVRQYTLQNVRMILRVLISVS